MRINLEGLTKKYGSLRALEAITAQIDPGQVVAFLGPNGAGKTTLLRCMAGVISPSAGRVVYDDLEFNRGMMDLQKRMFFLPDVPFVFEEWCILRHLGMALRLTD
jgi:ABC-2 type transport system ATP-binding protein